MNILKVIFVLASLATLIYYFLGILKIQKPNGALIAPLEMIKSPVLLLIAFILLLLAFSFKEIKSDEGGVKFTFGAISNSSLAPGLHFYAPFVQSIKTITCRPIEIPIEITVDSEGAITKDNQTIGAHLSLYIVYDREKLPLMWKAYGEEKMMSIATQSAVEAFKAQVGRYVIFELPITQDTIQRKTIGQIRGMIASYPMKVSELKITNYDWSDEFDTQIKQTMNRSQQVKQKAQELLIAEQEAQKKVKQAEANKTATITAAEGRKIAAGLDADAKVLQGEGIRQYNAAIALNFQMELEFRKLQIELNRVEKWDGHYVSTNNYGPIPFANSSLQGK